MGDGTIIMGIVTKVTNRQVSRGYREGESSHLGIRGGAEIMATLSSAEQLNDCAWLLDPALKKSLRKKLVVRVAIEHVELVRLKPLLGLTTLQEFQTNYSEWAKVSVTDLSHLVHQGQEVAMITGARKLQSSWTTSYAGSLESNGGRTVIEGHLQGVGTATVRTSGSSTENVSVVRIQKKSSATTTVPTETIVEVRARNGSAPLFRN